MDHNSSDDSKEFQQNRLQEISNLNNQFRNLLNQEKLKLKQVHLLLNKRDLWVNEKEEKREILNNWFIEEVNRWNTGSFANYVTSDCYSNRINSDLNELIKNLKI